MRRGFLAAAVAVAAAVGLAGPLPAASASGVGTASFDRLSRGRDATWTRRSSELAVLQAAVVSNRIAITTSDGRVTYITLGDGTLPQPGTTYSLASGSTRSRITGQCSTPGAGTLVVDDVVYDGTTVTTMVASYAYQCSITDPDLLSGTIRVGSTAPASAVRPAPVRAPTTGRSTRSSVPVTFTNTGNAPTATLGAAALDATVTGSSDFAVTDDQCAGRQLAPADSCQVALSFGRVTAGTSGGLLTVPDGSVPGGLLVAGVEGTTVEAPAAPVEVRVFPVRSGVGVAWTASGSGWPASAYRVQRQAADGSWSDVWGPSAGTWSWADSSLAPGASATYRVVGENLDGPGTPSAEVTGTRPVQEPQVGTTDAVTADLDAGGAEQPWWLSEVVATDVTAQDPPLSGGSLQQLTSLGSSTGHASLPQLLPGPGSYQVNDAVLAPKIGATVYLGAPSACNEPTGRLDVEEVAYTAGGALETLAARYRLDCPQAPSTYGELRWHSTVPFQALVVTPARQDAGRVPVGQASTPLVVTLANRGTADQVLGARSVSGPASARWAVSSDDCPDTLVPGASCTVAVTPTPTGSGPSTGTLAFSDSTARGGHHAAFSVTGTSLPSAPAHVQALRLPGGGVDLSWDRPADDGGTGLQHYVVYRTTGGVRTQVDVPDLEASRADPQAPADVTYAVSAVSEVGEGAPSPATTPHAVEEPLFVEAALTSQSRTLFLGVFGNREGTRVLPWAPRGGENGTGFALGLNPDGTQLLSVQSSDGGWTLWREPVDRSSAPVALLTGAPLLDGPRWSPDGTRISVTSRDTVPTTVVLDAAKGTRLQSVTGLEQADWLADSRTLVGVDGQVQARPLVRVDAATGRRLGQLTGTDGAVAPAVSPDGRWVAFTSWNGTGGTYLLPATGGAVTRLSSSVATDLSWSPDGRTLAEAGGRYGSLWMVRVGDAGTPESEDLLSARVSTTFDHVAWGGTRVSIGPSAAVTGPSASFTVASAALPADSTLTCALDDRTPVACSGTYTASGLTTGTHTLRVRSTSPDGRRTVAARLFTADATAPSGPVMAATPAVTTAPTWTVRYSATDSSGVASYDLRYRRAGLDGRFGAYAAWLTGTRTTSATLSPPAGYRYCVSVRARDAFGNTTSWSPERCTARPLDDHSLRPVTAGWSRTTSSALYLGTGTTTTRHGATLTLANVSSRQVFLVATKCSTCGSLAVYVGPAYVGYVSLRSTRAANQVIIALPTTALRTGTLRVVVSSATGHFVRLDGIWARAT
ncbi:MAG: choice-of-anchor D domain-containing protein [Angustibacter sp.]